VTATDKQHGAADDVEALAQAADRLFYAMRRARSAIGDLATGGLSMAQLVLLDPLADRAGGAGGAGGADVDGLPVSRLAERAEVSVPTATRMLQQLEAKGVVSRHRSAQDERKVLVRLTEDGADRLGALRTELRARQFEALSRYSRAERGELARNLHRLADTISAMPAVRTSASAASSGSEPGTR
jgi:DNA-binding MarR family transcriptional regulator